MASTWEIALLTDVVSQRRDILERALRANAAMPGAVAPVDIDAMRIDLDNALLELERAKNEKT